VTGLPASNENEAKWWRALSQPQRDYLINIAKARPNRWTKRPGLFPDPALDGETKPAPAPDFDGDESPDKCQSKEVPRRGGHALHDAYATKVTGSPNDFWAKPPKSPDAINYDGRSTGNQVWEVKTGFGWMFNPRCYDMALRTIAGWEVQRARGLAIARACAYVHLWSVTDPYVAAGLNARWGGSPPVLNVAE
jgi:hypothetical protein